MAQIERSNPLGDADARRLLAAAPFTVLAEGSCDNLEDQLGRLPRVLRDDILSLAVTFAALMSVKAVRVKLKAVTTNACHKLHSDLTNLRLITTYAGPGTDYLADADDEGSLARLPTGHIGLFKGRTYGEGHGACLHRSPPVEHTGERRLLLVIDTPEFGTQLIDPAYPDPEATAAKRAA
nr:DUF1826 domain-containing protein [Pacificimonas pallii]